MAIGGKPGGHIMELSVKEVTEKVKKTDEGEEVSFVTKLTDGPEEEAKVSISEKIRATFEGGDKVELKKLSSQTKLTTHVPIDNEPRKRGRPKKVEE
jgi:hypothetical protein